MNSLMGLRCSKAKLVIWHSALLLLVLLYSAVSPLLASAADDISAHVEVGIRDVNVSGDRNKYRQQIDLDDGVRLFELGLRYAPDETKQTNPAVPDLVTVDAFGLGGDPYQNARLEIRRYGRYRFRYEHRKSDYFYQDLLIRPEQINIESSNEGDLHHFDFERTTDSANFELQLTDRAKLLVAYDRYQKNGDSTTVLDIQREEFELDNPIDQALEVFDFGLSYAWDKVTLSYNERWRDFSSDLSISSAGVSEGLDLSGPTAVDFFTLDQNYDYASREHQLGVLVRPSERWNLQLDLFNSELDMDVDSFEDALGIDFANLPFRTQDRNVGESKRDTNQFYLSVSYAISDGLRLVGNVREQRLDQDAASTGVPGTGLGDWRIDNNRIGLGVEAAPSKAWTVSAGWSRQRRQAQYGLSEKETARNAGYWLQVLHRSSIRMQWRLSIEDNSIDNAFTTASATDARRFRLRGRYRWDMGLVLSVSLLRREHENQRSDWQSDTQQSVVKIAYIGDKLTLSLDHTWLDYDRSIAQVVTGGFRQDLFNIANRADTKYWDASIQWALNEKWDLTASHRDYRNSGNFDTDRDDTRMELGLALSKRYRLYLRYRHTSFAEPPAENFTANIVELAVGYRR
jgi:hypothetical protein